MLNDPTRYRASILAAGGLLTAVLLQIGAALAPGTPLGGIDWVTLLFSALVLVAVYFPSDPWAKLTAAVAGAIGQTVIAAMTDDRFTAAEFIAIAVALLTAVGVGVLPNAGRVTVTPVVVNTSRAH
jgi:hypothetical protein